MGQVLVKQHQKKVYISYSRYGKVYRRPTPVKWSERNTINGSMIVAAEKERVQQVITDFIKLHGSQPTRDYVKNKLNEKQLKKSDVFLDFFDDFIEEKEKDVKPSSLKDYTSWKNSLVDYQSYYKITLTFDNINIDFGRKWIDFLLSTDRPKDAKTKGGMNDTTISKRITSFRNYMKWIESNEIFQFDKKIKEYKPIQNYATDIIHLSMDEQKQLYELNKLSPKLEMARDIFIFACMTSLRYSDILTLEPRHISPEYKVVKKSEKGRKGEKYVLFLNKYAIEIWEKYDKNLNRFYSQKFNKLIKEVCIIGNLFQEPISKIVIRNGVEVELEPVPKYKLITSHTARRSFITNQIEKGTSLNKLMEMTSHTKIDTLVKYIHKSGSTKESTDLIAF